jgi:signal transduction histidine kinase
MTRVQPNLARLSPLRQPDDCLPDLQSSVSHVARASPPFLDGGGDMGERIRSFNWSVTAIGPPEIWPQPLRTALRILLTTNHPVFIFWGDSLTCFYNDAYARSLGPEKHPGILGMPGRVVWDEIWPIIGPQIDLVMSGSGATWHENQLVPITRFGAVQDVYWTYSYGPIQADAAVNEVGGVLVLCTETTDHVLSEARMRADATRWRALFEQSPGIMCVLRGPEHRFEYANPPCRALLGRVVMPVGETLVDVVPDVVGQGFLELLDDVYRDGRSHSAVGARILLAGMERYVDFVYQPLTDESGAVNGILVQGFDVTEREVAQARLRDADRWKDVFLATLAHELRNPLAPIRNAAQILSMSGIGQREVDWAQQVIARQSQHMASLLDDLLDVARLTQGRLDLHREIVEIRTVIDAAVESVRPQLEAKHHVLRLEVPTGLSVTGDQKRLCQMFSNLLSNAIRYAEPGGRIDVSSTANALDVTIAIHDTGIGMNAAALGNAFGMFRQSEAALESAEGGLGIGLAIVRAIAELHHGSAAATSEGLGLGSTFSVTLPLAQRV